MSQRVSIFGKWEQTICIDDDRPEVELCACHLTSPSGRKRAGYAFWDGGATWRIRFMPDQEGQWRCDIPHQATIPGLRGRSFSFLCTACSESEQNPLLRHGPLRVAHNGRHLERADGTPWFYMADTAWNGPLASRPADWERYLDDRTNKHFTAVQFVAHAPWRAANTDAEGRIGFEGRSNIRINPAAFERIDKRIDSINARGMVAVPVLTWACMPEDPGQYLPEPDVFRLIQYQATRWAGNHIIWIMAGDGNYGGCRARRWKRIGRQVFNHHPRQPVMIHPLGSHWPYRALRPERWLDIIGYQSGHGDDHEALRWVHSGPPAREWKVSPPRPVLNLEPPYEGLVSYQSHQPLDAYAVRRAAYWSILNAPPAGLAYGAHGVWSWEETARTPLNHEHCGIAPPWHEAMQLPGSIQMKYLADLFASVRWWDLRPDSDLLKNQPFGDDSAKHVSAARTEVGDLAIIYLPVGARITLNANRLSITTRAAWFDPRSSATYTTNAMQDSFRPPDDADWVLVLTA